MRKRVQLPFRNLPLIYLFSHLSLYHSRNFGAQPAHSAQEYRTQSLRAAGGDALSGCQRYLPTNSATALKGQVWLVLLLFRKAGFIWKRRKKPLWPRIFPQSQKMFGTHAAQANPVLAALRHVLRVITLRPVSPVFCALDPTNGRCTVVAVKAGVLKTKLRERGHELKMLKYV